MTILFDCSSLVFSENPQIYRTFCKRLSVLAANMGLKGLWIAITRACSKAEDIIAADAGAPGRTIIDLSSTTSKTVGPSACDWTISGRASVTAASDKRSLAPVRDPVVPLETVVGRATGKTAGAVLRETKPKANGAVANASSRSWAHARAALVLRTDAVAVALRWSTGAKSIQVRQRSYAGIARYNDDYMVIGKYVGQERIYHAPPSTTQDDILFESISRLLSCKLSTWVVLRCKFHFL